ncbi:hypothetical protein FAZ95_25675 [Trinickia violacea]|uniref:Preprotein translocase subunit SecD n=1 Tax=Trinickia violacea TaxID=2571746 RepID=A0A4P8IZ50_9BURK|nr:hypothetical protein [Trinickia violacea]QCP52554.1 hypothetical protein FAZ95_25675 [Trinickia violacea]
MRAEDMLPDDKNAGEFNGVVVRKGSVGAFLANAKTLADPQVSDEARALAERDMVELLPALRALGVFDVFEIRDATLRALVNDRVVR